jgi:hypothetical protein
MVERVLLRTFEPALRGSLLQREQERPLHLCV